MENEFIRLIVDSDDASGRFTFKKRLVLISVLCIYVLRLSNEENNYVPLMYNFSLSFSLNLLKIIRSRDSMI